MSCPSLDSWAAILGAAALAGVVVAAIPAAILKAVGEGELVRPLYVTLAVLAAGVVGCITFSFWDCGPDTWWKKSEPVQTDSLYRSWVHFSGERDSVARVEISHAIYCESARIRAIGPAGEEALRETETKVAPRERFARLAAAARSAYVPPTRPTAHPCGPKLANVTGHVLDDSTGRTLGFESMGIVILSSSPHATPVGDGGGFRLNDVPATGDSATLVVCADRYRPATRRILISDGEDQSMEVTLHRKGFDGQKDYGPCNAMEKPN